MLAMDAHSNYDAEGQLRHLTGARSEAALENERPRPRGDQGRSSPEVQLCDSEGYIDLIQKPVRPIGTVEEVARGSSIRSVVHQRAREAPWCVDRVLIATTIRITEGAERRTVAQTSLREGEVVRVHVEAPRSVRTAQVHPDLRGVVSIAEDTLRRKRDLEENARRRREGRGGRRRNVRPRGARGGDDRRCHSSWRSWRRRRCRSRRCGRRRARTHHVRAEPLALVDQLRAAAVELPRFVIQPQLSLTA